ncbi:hypothetical protein J1605_000271, partial [Eschrichtius robustus]
EGTRPTGSSLPDGLPPPLEPAAAVGHQTEHPRPLLPPPPIRARSGGAEGPPQAPPMHFSNHRSTARRRGL